MFSVGDCVAYRPRPAAGWGAVTRAGQDSVTAKYYVGYFIDITGPPGDFRLVRRKGQDDDRRREK